MIIIEDNFYDDPEEVYQKAISVEYNSGEKEGGHAGQRSIKPYFKDIALEKISRLLQFSIESDSDDTAKFQYCTQRDRVWVHTDPFDYAAIIYLDRYVPVNAGTSFYTWKETNENTVPADYIKTPKRFFEENPYPLDMTKWEENCRVGLRFNRILLYPGCYFHDATNYYGNSFEDARLFQTFFLNRVK
jgi:hypothetical protein